MNCGDKDYDSHGSDDDDEDDIVKSKNDNHVNGALLKMAPIKDGSFGPVAATAAAAPPRRHRPAVEVVKQNRSFLLWTVLNRFGLF